MANPDEQLIHVVDDDSRILGPIARGLCHGNPALIHRAVHVLVLNKAGRLLLQKRSKWVDSHPGKWDTSVGGHVGFGQSYLEAALREIEEEIGIPAGNIEPLYSLRFRNAQESENICTYLLKHDGPFQPHPDEVEELRFWSRVEIESALKQGVFTQNFEEEFEAFKASPAGEALL